MSETTKKEEQFVLKILETVQEYENADFNIIEALRVILKMVIFARGTGTPMSEVIKDNKEEWGMNDS
ncbi:hypothetical protein [uncultured Granulicatella sp.]|jgi:hypothetical protein|uniref:hypothetical protein n=1 Tax=uncultured Granulicatella sp. TaxID=316089 RepID=UPI0026222B79|nr:hypothetical protein [uncultured Granulicatella sp.]